MSEVKGFGLAEMKTEGSKTPYDREYPTAGDAARMADYVKLSSGRQFYANFGILGLGPDGSVTEGYDGSVDTDDFTAAERRELAEMMIDRWRKWGEA